MFEKSNKTVKDVMTMLTGIHIRHTITDECKLSITEMIKILAGPDFYHLNISKYRFREMFDPPDEEIMFHYYCDKCYKSILYSTSKKQFKRTTVVCSRCSVQFVLTLKSTNYFIILDLKYQLSLLFKNSSIKKEILTYMNQIKEKRCNPERSKNICDIHDGELSEEINSSEDFYFTYNVGNDGAPLSSSGKQGGWPLGAVPNFLSPKLRSKFYILCGMLTCSEEPKTDLLANLFFDKFIDQVIILHEDGLKITNLDSEEETIKFCPVSFDVDSVCRPILQSRLQFNGHYGCSWCYHFGNYVKKLGIRYKNEENDSDIRTHESHKQDVAAVEESHKRDVRGVKGYSSLLRIPFINIVWSFPLDYLHCILLGIDQYLYKLWTQSKSKSPFKLNKRDIKTIDERLSSIRRSQDIHRHQGEFRKKLKWKGSQIKFWMLDCAIPCLKGVLHVDALRHYALLITTLHTLLKTNITEEDLNKCERDAITFVTYFEIYYGGNNVTFNVHSLLHVVRSVKYSGPLWSHSTFPFESEIYYLKKLIGGPSKMDEQISKKHLIKWLFKTGNVTCLSDEVKDFCENLFKAKRLSSHFIYGEDGVVVYVGKFRCRIIEEKCYKVYKKIIYNGKVLHSKQYTKAQCTDDTNIQLKSGAYAKVLLILEHENKCYLKISKYRIHEDDIFNLTHIKQIECEDVEECIISISEFDSKVILININHEKFLSRLPNDFEIQ